MKVYSGLPHASIHWSEDDDPAEIDYSIGVCTVDWRVGHGVTGVVDCTDEYLQLKDADRFSRALTYYFGAPLLVGTTV
jgi:hypothetical protein